MWSPRWVAFPEAASDFAASMFARVRRARARRLVCDALSFALLVSCASGCYFAELGARQLELVNEQQPLPRAIAGERDPERRAMLSMVPALRSFARDTMQLPVGRSYAGYYATEDSGILFVLVASERTRFVSYNWWFPIVGTVSYKSFTREADARAQAAELRAAGYDTWVGPVTAYSTLGFCRDPVTTVMMRKGVVAFVEVLLHEMAHAKLYVPGHTDWNEQLASFVGRKGAAQYLRTRCADQPLLLSELAAREQRRASGDVVVRAALAELDALYASRQSRAAILAKRERVFARLSAELRALHPEAEPAELEINNAHLLQYRRYLVGSEQLDRLWQQANASWPRFWALCQAYAKTL
jgi:predicted aminopeptidase